MEIRTTKNPWGTPMANNKKLNSTKKTNNKNHSEVNPVKTISDKKNNKESRPKLYTTPFDLQKLKSKNRKDWSATLKIEYDHKPEEDPNISGLILNTVDEKSYLLNFERINVYKEPKAELPTYRIHLFEPQSSDDSDYVALKVAMWAVELGGLSVLSPSWANRDLRLLEFSVATKTSSATARKYILESAVFADESVAQKETL